MENKVHLPHLTASYFPQRPLGKLIQTQGSKSIFRKKTLDFLYCIVWIHI
jgi:hypothetical protein